MSCVIPMSPLGVIDESDEFHQELMEDGQQAVSGVVMAVIMESMLIQRLEKSRMNVIVPMQAKEVFALDLCASRTSMLFSVLVIMSCICICLIMHAFL